MIIRLKPAPPHHPGHPAHRPDCLAAPLTNVIDHLHFHDIRHHQPVKTIHHDRHHDQPIKKLSSQCAIQYPQCHHCHCQTINITSAIGAVLRSVLNFRSWIS